MFGMPWQKQLSGIYSECIYFKETADEIKDCI